MALKVLGKTLTFFHFRHVKMTVGSCQSISHSQLNAQTSSMLECQNYSKSLICRRLLCDVCLSWICHTVTDTTFVIEILQMQLKFGSLKLQEISDLLTCACASNIYISVLWNGIHFSKLFKDLKKLELFMEYYLCSIFSSIYSQHNTVKSKQYPLKMMVNVAQSLVDVSFAWCTHGHTEMFEC